MVGKLVTKGITRSVSLRKMKAALDGLFIEGLKTNVPLHKVILENEKFVGGNYSTKFIGEEKPQDDVKTDFDYEKIYSMLATIEARRMWVLK